MIHCLKAFESEIKPGAKFNEIRELHKIDKLEFERTSKYDVVKRFGWRYLNITSDSAMQCIFGKDAALLIL